ncbi:hypothetical protein EV663_11638 [Rhodovulum bhavnagarense]|uniref:N(2)-fixation sustaining protein CowN n=1 Tax=Rhodovulum bhavnagarense TaxID=992286 RepID=A0A4R2RAJ4_9RHOB|nr:N(2)-fixation sustaining protein CowN [Rhodovulum bhavnagarense]TCP59743.1 hypothetical protein EV663_11638 [Rhodovulum bhavnagarense]
MTDHSPDRYVSFSGIDCDGRAARLMQMLDAQIAATDSRWVAYFEMKLVQRQRMGNDDLHFIGSQVNTLRAFFEEIDDQAALGLLDDLEQTCC